MTRVMALMKILADSSFVTKRSTESPNCLEESKKYRYDDIHMIMDQNDETGDNHKQNPVQNYEKDDMFASQESMRSSQLSMWEGISSSQQGSFNNTGLDYLNSSEDEDMLLSQVEQTVGDSRINPAMKSAEVEVQDLCGNSESTNTKHQKVSSSQEDGSNHPEDVPRLSQKERNRKYARDSRQRKDKKIKVLEELTTQQECMLEIYKKVITIYHKKLKGGTVPSWTNTEINWYSGKANGHEECRRIRCQLPLLDNALIEELGNGAYGKIISSDPSLLDEIPLCHKQIGLQIPESLQTPQNHNVAHMDNDFTEYMRPKLSSTTAENSSSGNVFRPQIVRVNAGISSEKARNTASTSRFGKSYNVMSGMQDEPVDVDDNGRNRCETSFTSSPPKIAIKSDLSEDVSQSRPVLHNQAPLPVSSHVANMTTQVSPHQFNSTFRYQIIKRLPKTSQPMLNTTSGVRINPSTVILAGNHAKVVSGAYPSADPLLHTGTLCHVTPKAIKRPAYSPRKSNGSCSTSTSTLTSPCAFDNTRPPMSVPCSSKFSVHEDSRNPSAHGFSIFLRDNCSENALETGHVGANKTPSTLLCRSNSSPMSSVRRSTVQEQEEDRTRSLSSPVPYTINWDQNDLDIDSLQPSLETA